MLKISIITVSYNSEATIKDTIESILNQTQTDFEYLIVDGSSKDSTLEIIKSYEEDFLKKGIDYKWISEPDKGIYDAMNKGVNLSTNDIVSFINSDDWYDERTVEIVVNNFKRLSAIDLLYGNMTMIKEDNGGHILKKPKELSKLNKEQNIYFPSVFIRSEVLSDNNPSFDLRFKLASDYKFLLQSYLNGRNFHYLNENLSFYRLGGSTTQQIKKSWSEVKEIQLEAGRNKILVVFNYYEKVVKRLILKAINRL